MIIDSARYRFAGVAIMRTVWIKSVADKPALAVLVAILFLAAGLRLYHLGVPGLWTDEFTVAQFLLDAPSINPVHDKSQTPIDFVTRYPLTKWYKTDFAFRFPSVVAGVLSVLLIYLVSARILPSMALLAAFLVAINPSHIRYSQEGRYYIWIYLSTLCLLLALYRFREKPSRFNIAALTLAIPFAALNQRTCIIIPWVVIPLFALISFRSFTPGHWKRLGLAFVLGNLLCFPAYLGAFNLQAQANAGISFHPNPAETLQQITAGRYLEVIAQLYFTEFGTLGESPSGITDFVVIALFFIGIVYLAYRVRYNFILLAGSFFALVTVIFIFSMQRMLPHERYVYFAVPFGHLICASALYYIGQTLVSGLARLHSASVYRAAAWSGIAMILFAASVPGLTRYYRELKYATNISVDLLGKMDQYNGKVTTVFPEQFSRVWTFGKWYFEGRDDRSDLSRNIQRIDSKSTQTVATGIQNILGEKSSVWIAGMTGQKMSEADNHIAAMFNTYSTNFTGFKINLYDGTSVFFTSALLHREPDKVQRVTSILQTLRELEGQGQIPLHVRASISSQKLLMVKQLPGNQYSAEFEKDRETVAQHAYLPHERAALLIELERLEEAEKALFDAIEERPTYFFQYVLLSQLYEEFYKKTEDPDYLIKASRVFFDAEKRGALLPPWTFQMQLGLIDKLKEAYLIEVYKTKLTSNPPHAKQALAAYKKLPGRKLEKLLEGPDSSETSDAKQRN